MNKKLITIIITIVLVLTACAIEGNVTTEEPIRLGSILIQTGDGNSWGQSARIGIDMAVEDINTNGGLFGRKLIVDHQDSKSDPKTAINTFQYLLSRNTNLIIGPT